MSDDSQHQQTFKNIGYNTIAKILSNVLSAVTGVVLGRCLLASDYGVASFSFIFVNFMDKFADVGIGTALVQKKELDATTLNTAFTLKFVIGCVVAVATFSLSFIVPNFISNHDAVVIVQLLSLCFLFNNIYFLPNALLTREMNFKKISLAETFVYFLNSLVTIILALKGCGYWSIVIAYLSSSFFGAVMLILFKPVSVRFCFDAPAAKQLVSVGGYLFLSGLFAFLISNFDNFIIGAVQGAQDLGYYAVAFNWGSMICLIMYSVVLRVILPVMAKLQDNVDDIRSSYLKTLEYSGYLIVLANITLFATSKDFLVSILGHGSNKWLPALVSLRILCVYGIVRGLLEPINQVVVALGKTKVLFQANFVASIVEVSCIYPALRYFGIEGVASVVTVAYLSQYILYYYYLKEKMQIRVGDLALAVKPSFLAALPVLILSFLLPDTGTDGVFAFLQKVFLMAAIYLVTLGIVTNWAILQQIKKFWLNEKAVRKEA